MLVRAVSVKDSFARLKLNLIRTVPFLHLRRFLYHAFFELKVTINMFLLLLFVFKHHVIGARYFPFCQDSDTFPCINL